jgi:hypothetical protein
MVLELERGLELFFSKKIEASYHSSSCVLCSFTSNIQRTFVALQFVCPMTQKSLNLNIK